MDITFRTLGPWGSGKGANLQPSEVDGNFWSLGQAIVDLQNNPALPNSIASIVVSGTQMTIYLSDGTVMGPFALPVLTFRWRGPWQPSTPYAELDVFTVTDTGIFMVQVSYVSGTSFDPTITDAGGNPILLQLFGSVDAKLSTLSDVRITGLTDSEVLVWNAGDGFWENQYFGSMAGQDEGSVFITGGSITGMPHPTNPTDVATKAYADALPTGATTPDKTIMSNISGVFGPAVANPLSDVLDYILSTTIRGTLLYRGPTGWAALAPGTAGQYLETQGAGFDPQWAPGGSGVTAVFAGTGIAASPSPIIGSGTVSLATLPDSDFLANISGTSAAPVPVTLTQFLDHVLGSPRGTLLTRTASGWVALAPGTSGLFLKTQGGGADLMWDAPAGAGTVTSVAAGSGLTASPSPIVATGTIGLSPVADGTVLGNTSGGTLAPVGTTLTLLLDHVFSGTQGAVMYRGATAWLALAPGTSGQILTTGGSAANPSWQNAPITGSSTPNLRILANISGSAAVPWNTAAARWQNHSLSAYLDAVFGAARGTVFYRGATGWVALAPGTAGQVLQTGGVAADPLWATIADPRLQLTAPAAGDVLIYNAGSGTFQNQRAKYVVAAFVPGVMTQANQSLLFHKVTKNLTIPANFAAYQGHTSEAGGSTVTTGAVTVTIARAAAASPTTFTTIGSIAFGAGTLTGVFSTQAATNLGTGDIIRVRGPATPDATFADFHASLVAFET